MTDLTLAAALVELTILDEDLASASIYGTSAQYPDEHLVRKRSEAECHLGAAREEFHGSQGVHAQRVHMKWARVAMSYLLPKYRKYRDTGAFGYAK